MGKQDDAKARKAAERQAMAALAALEIGEGFRNEFERLERGERRRKWWAEQGVKLVGLVERHWPGTVREYTLRQREAYIPVDDTGYIEPQLSRG